MSQKQVDGVVQALETLRDIDADMPVTMGLSLLLIARNEGLSLKELANKAGVGMASASRYVAAFGKPGKPGGKGLGLVTAVEDPEERRKKIITLTPKGKTFINKLVGE